MNTLADAWGWYQAAKHNLQRMQRIASKHWEDPSLNAASIWQDEKLKMLDSDEITRETTQALEHLDDLAIVVLFQFSKHRCVSI